MIYSYEYDIILLSKGTITGQAEKGEKMEIMTDKQFDKILKMVSMILDGCKNLDEAKEKVAELLEEQKKEKSNE